MPLKYHQEIVALLGIDGKNSEEVRTFLFHPDCPVFQVDHLPSNTCLGVTSDFWIGVLKKEKTLK